MSCRLWSGYYQLESLLNKLHLTARTKWMIQNGTCWIHIRESENKEPQKFITQLQYSQVSAAEANAKSIPGDTEADERGRTQRHGYVFDSCEVAQEGSRACSRHCWWGAELSQWQSSVEHQIDACQKCARDMHRPASPACCSVGVQLHFPSDSHVSREPGITCRSMECPWLYALQSEGPVQLFPVYPCIEDTVPCYRRSAGMWFNLPFSSTEDIIDFQLHFFLG